MGPMIQSRRWLAGPWRRRLVLSLRRLGVVVAAIIAAYIALLSKPEVLMAPEVRVQNLALHASNPLPAASSSSSKRVR